MKIKARLLPPPRALENTRQIFSDTEALLLGLGYDVVWQLDGNAAIIIGDYPERPIVDHFRMVWVAPPVGYAQPARTENPAHYSFQPPACSALGQLESADIRQALRELDRYVRSYAKQHALNCEPSALAPLLYLLGDEPERIRECLARGVHPKWLADMLAFGLGYAEALELKGVPYETLYTLYAR